MARNIEDEVAYYYDFHPTEEDLMGETAVHARLVRYLMEVLNWLFRGRVCAIHENLNFYQTINDHEHPLVPDVAVIKGVPFEEIRSWRIGTNGPIPHVVFEIASEETWDKDLGEKVWKYARMGVQEYFAYDPNVPPILRGSDRRLFGWQLDQDTRTMQELPIGPGGQLWSTHLDCFLVPDGSYLRLYNSKGDLCLTQGEAESQRADAEAEQAELERQRADTEAEQAELERQRANAETQRAEQERQRAEAEARRNQALIEKLRSLGIDPDQI